MVMSITELSWHARSSPISSAAAPTTTSSHNEWKRMRLHNLPPRMRVNSGPHSGVGAPKFSPEKLQVLRNINVNADVNPSSMSLEPGHPTLMTFQPQNIAPLIDEPLPENMVYRTRNRASTASYIPPSSFPPVTTANVQPFFNPQSQTTISQLAPPAHPLPSSMHALPIHNNHANRPTRNLPPRMQLQRSSPDLHARAFLGRSKSQRRHGIGADAMTVLAPMTLRTANNDATFALTPQSHGHTSTLAPSTHFTTVQNGFHTTLQRRHSDRASMPTTQSRKRSPNISLGKTTQRPPIPLPLLHTPTPLQIFAQPQHPPPSPISCSSGEMDSLPTTPPIPGMGYSPLLNSTVSTSSNHSSSSSPTLGEEADLDFDVHYTLAHALDGLGIESSPNSRSLSCKNKPRTRLDIEDGFIKTHRRGGSASGSGSRAGSNGNDFGVIGDHRGLAGAFGGARYLPNPNYNPFSTEAN